MGAIFTVSTIFVLELIAYALSHTATLMTDSSELKTIVRAVYSQDYPNYPEPFFNFPRSVLLFKPIKFQKIK